MRCAVKNCNNNNKSKLSTMSFFNFPSDTNLLKQWRSFCRRDSKMNVKTSQICMEHFKPEDLENSLQFEMGFTKKRYLKRGAVPTVHKESSTDEERHKDHVQRIKNHQNKQIVDMFIEEHDAESISIDEKLEIIQCRTCYNATKGLKPLSDLTNCSGGQQISYAELLADVSNINIMEDFYNELPQFICEVCQRKLKAAQAFIQQTHEVNERLIALLSSQKESNILEETPVQVKMEYDETITEAETESHWQVELKQEESEEIPEGLVSGMRAGDGNDNMEFFKINKVNPTTDVQSDITQMLQLLNRKIDMLTHNNEILKNQMRDIKNQNTMVLNVLSENTDAIEKSLNKNPKYLKMFPISTINQLNEIEDSINEQNEKEFISSIRAIAGQRGLKKGLSDIMTPKLLVEFNVDGSHNKQRLLNYTKFVNVLFHGTYDENCTEKSFKCHLRDALKLVKNRYFKEKCISKDKNENIAKESSASKNGDTQDIQQNDVVNT
ncbi:uncharacterized protein LOC135956715 [Calliphora vicina]|uniref:uncharacterized protein LOC135956715 n=1 Tax=Calliphora vicina TaxID=7373 RepID=UPI00325A994F